MHHLDVLDVKKELSSIQQTVGTHVILYDSVLQITNFIKAIVGRQTVRNNG
jgi:hypothetical protein